MKIYEYVGDGMGVPGLPHVITDEQAKELGVEKILTAAIANGSYRESNTGTQRVAKAKPSAEEKE